MYFKLPFLLGLTLLLSCFTKEKRSIPLPKHFPKPYSILEIDEAKFEFGKQLFFDHIFSKDSSISCASCHHPSTAFADVRPFSVGVRGQLGKRNAPALQNLLWSNTFFWDGGVHNMELIPLNPITNEKELDESMPNIVFKINKSRKYLREAKEIYQSDTLNSHQLLEVLTHYQAALISDQSKFDQYLMGKTKLSTEEMEGYQLFQAKCGQCHSGPLLSNYQYKNNGIYKASDTDQGRYEISLIESDKGKFKVPSLRNIEVTAPYMHNSSLHTLRDVLNHYESGIHSSPTLDSSLRHKISFKKGEKEKIISFLKTLTDREFLKEERFKPK